MRLRLEEENDQGGAFEEGVYDTDVQERGGGVMVCLPAYNRIPRHLRDEGGWFSFWDAHEEILITFWTGEKQKRKQT